MANTMTEVSAPEVSEGITRQKYTALKNGMTYKQVVAISGSEGEEMSSKDIAGIHMVMYKWKASRFGTTMNAMFQNNRLISKARFGLT